VEFWIWIAGANVSATVVFFFLSAMAEFFVPLLEMASVCHVFGSDLDNSD